MRDIWLGAALLPYLALAGADAWVHERGRKVPRVEQALHALLALTFTAFVAGIFMGRDGWAAGFLAAFVATLAFDELGWHGGIARNEQRLHRASWAALALFVAVWVALRA